MVKIRNWIVHLKKELKNEVLEYQNTIFDVNDIIKQHSKSKNKNTDQLLMVVQSEGGTGKSYVIKCLQNLLMKNLRVCAFIGSASYLI